MTDKLYFILIWFISVLLPCAMALIIGESYFLMVVWMAFAYGTATVLLFLINL